MATPPSGPTKSNLDIALQLASVITQITSELDKQTEVYKQQVQIVEALCKAQECFGELDSKKIESISTALREATGNVEKFGSKTQEATVLAGKLGEAVEKVHNWAKKLSVPAEFLNGFKAGFSLSTNLFKNIMRMGGTALEFLKNIGGVLLSIPGRIMDFFQGAAGGGSDAYKAALEELRDAFGNLEVGTSKAVKSMTEDLKNFNSIGVSFNRVFGYGREGMAKLLTENMELAKGMGFMFNRMAESLNGNILGLTVLRKATGMSAEAFKSLTLAAEGSGRSTGSMISEMNIKLAQAEKTFGISTKEIGRDVDAMLKDTATFGRMAPDAMIKTSVYVKKLGLSIESLKKVMDKSLNFEDAAQQAASLSEAFNMNIDAMKLMKEQDPTKKLDMIREGFFRTGKSVESLSIAEMKALSNATNLSDEELRLSFSLKNRGLSQAQIAEQMKKGQKNQMTEAEAMQTLAKSIKQLVQSGSGMKGSFFDIFMKGFEHAIRRSHEFRQVVRNLQRSMKEVWRGGVQVGRMFLDFFPGFRQMLGGLADMFNPARFRALMDKVVGTFGDFFIALQTNPEAGFKTFMKKMKEHFLDFFNAGSPAGSSFLNGLMKFFKAIGTIMIQGLKYGLSAMADLLKGIVSYIKNPTSLNAVATEAGSGIKGMFLKAFIYAKEQLLPVMKDVGAAFVELITVLFDRYIKPHMRKILLGLFAFFFGPAIVMGVVRGVIAGVLSGGLSGAVGLIKKASSTIKGAATGATGGAEGGEVTSESVTEQIKNAAKVLKETKGELTSLVLAISGIVLILLTLATLAQSSGVKPETMIVVTLMFGAVTLLIQHLVKTQFFQQVTLLGQFLKKMGPAATTNIVIGLGAVAGIMVAMAGIFAISAAMLSNVKKEDAIKTVVVLGAMTLMLMGISGAIAVLGLVGAGLSGPQILFVLAGITAAGLFLFGVAKLSGGVITEFVSKMRQSGINESAVKTVTEVLNSFVDMLVKISGAIAILSLSAPFAAVGAVVGRLFGGGTGGPVQQIKSVIEILTKSITDIIGHLSGLTGDPAVLKEKAAIFSTIAQGLGALIGPIVELIGDISSDFFAQGSAKAAEVAGKTLNDIIKVLAQKDTGVLNVLMKQISDAAASTTVDPTNLKTFAEVFTAIASGLGSIISAVASVLEQFSTNVGDMFSMAGQAASIAAKLGALTIVVQTVLPAIKTVVISMIEEMNRISGQVTNIEGLKALAPLLGSVGQVIGSIAQAIGSLMSGGGVGVAEELDNVVNVISGGSSTDVLSSRFNIVTDFIRAIKEPITGMFTAVITSLVPLVNAIPADPERIKGLGVIGEIIKSVTGIIVPIIQAITNLTQNIKSGEGVDTTQIGTIGASISTIINDISTSMSRIFTAVPALISGLLLVTIPDGLETRVKGIQSVFDLVKSIGSIISSFNINIGGSGQRTLNMWSEVFVPIIALLSYFVLADGATIASVPNAVGHKGAFDAVLNGIAKMRFPKGLSDKIATLKSIFETFKTLADTVKSLKDLAGANRTPLATDFLNIPLMNLRAGVEGLNSETTSDNKKNPLKDPELFAGLETVKDTIYGKGTLLTTIKTSLQEMVNAVGEISRFSINENIGDLINTNITRLVSGINSLYEELIGGREKDIGTSVTEITSVLNGRLATNIRGMVTAYNQFATEMAALNNIPTLDVTLERAGERLSANRALRIERGAFNMTVQVNVTLNAGDVTNALYRFNNKDNNAARPGNFSTTAFNPSESATP